MTRTETKGERKRTTKTKQNTSNSSHVVEENTPHIFSWALNRLLFSKSCLVGFSFVQEGKSNFYCQLELNNNYRYSFGHKEKVDLFVCFALKCERTSAF